MAQVKIYYEPEMGVLTGVLAVAQKESGSDRAWRRRYFN